MQVLLLLAHPSPGSFNHAIAETAAAALTENGHRVIFRDLYLEGFDPVLPGGEIPRDGDLDPVIAEHCRQLAFADGIVIVHPDWWGMPPAILKGWIDRVIRPGLAYRFTEGDSGEGIPEGLLKARAAVVFNTANTPRERETAVFLDPLETLWKNCILRFCGIPEVHRRMFTVVVTSTHEERRAWLEEVRDLVNRIYPSDSLSS